MGYTVPQMMIFLPQTSKPKNMLENIITEEEWTFFKNFGPTLMSPQQKNKMASDF